MKNIKIFSILILTAGYFFCGGLAGVARAEAGTLEIYKTGTGSGTVTSNPAGINCGATCSVNFSSGTVVTLTAIASSGSTFSGWSGSGCFGTGTCVETMAGGLSVQASFTTNPA